MEQQNFHRKVKAAIILIFSSGCVLAQTVVPFSSLPNQSTCNPDQDKIVYLHWNGSSYSNAIISPSKILNVIPNTSPVYFAKAATTSALAVSYSSGTITATSNGRLANQDGIKLTLYDNFLVKNNSPTLQNGLYVIYDTGTTSSTFKAYRDSSYNETSEIYPSQVNVLSGTVNGGGYFLQTTVNPVVGTDPIIYTSTPAPATVTSSVSFVDVVLTTALPNSPTYASGSVSGMPAQNATYKSTTSSGARFPTIGGIAPFVGMKVLVTGQADQTKNGDYIVIDIGNNSGACPAFCWPWIIQRVSYSSSMLYPHLWEVLQGTNKGAIYQQNNKSLVNSTIGSAGNITFTGISSTGGLIYITNLTTGVPTYYTTLDLAAAAATSGQQIHVNPGTYTVTTTATNGIAKDGVSYYFEPGAVINKSTAGALFNTSGFTTGFNVYGAGKFTTSGSAGAVLSYYGTSSTYDTFIAESAQSTSSVVFSINASSSSLFINVPRASSTAGNVLSNNQNINYLKIIGNYWNSSNGVVVYSGGSWTADINIASIISTLSYAISLQGTGSNTNISSSYILGTSGGILNQGGLTSKMNVTCAYTNGINDDGGSTLFEGSCLDLVKSGGYFKGGICRTITESGANTYVNTTISDLNINGFATQITQSGGTLDVMAGPINYGMSFNLTGGKTNFLNNVSGGQYGNGDRIINGGELTILGRFDYTSSGGGSYWSIFRLLSGKLRINNICTNGINDPLAMGIIWSGGDLILNGAIVTTANTTALPIQSTTASQNLRVYAAGYTSNKAGVVAGSSYKYKFTVSSAANSTLATLDDGTNPPQTFNVLVAGFATQALIAQQFVVLINGAGLNVTASQDTPGTDTYFYVTMSTPGPTFTFGTLTNLTSLLQAWNSYPVTNVTGGTIIENATYVE